jgi:hypothetical protein
MRCLLRVVLLRTVALAGFGTRLEADSICVSGGPCDQNWQTFPTLMDHGQGPPSTGSGLGSAYFDGWSWDGPDANIGYFIEGKGAFQSSPFSPDAALPFWGNADGSPVQSFYFQSDGESQVVNVLVAGGLWSPFSSLGWYDPNSNAWGWIIDGDGSTAVGQSIAFTPTAEFGLFFVPDSSSYDSPKYFTNSALDSPAAADVTLALQEGLTLPIYQQFAVFEDQTGGYYVGVEDRNPTVSDNDYNDMIFTLSGTPEPNMGPMVVIALGAFVLFRRFR